MSENTTAAVRSSGGGVATSSLLGVLFVGLKLTDVIDWSWVWVLSPFWIPAVLFVGIVTLILLFLVFFGGFAWLLNR